MFYAAANPGPHTLALLIERGGRVNTVSNVDDDCRYPIHIAAAVGRAKNVQLLIDAGSEIECSDRYRQCPLHLACWKGDRDTVKTLLEAGADINITDFEHETPLHKAAEAQNFGVVKMLVS